MTYKTILDLDEDGYPTEEMLQAIREWKGDYAELLAQVRLAWRYADCGYWSENSYDWMDIERGSEYHASTAGWSGNESLIEALEGNRIFWAMCWYSSTRGGHHVFRIRQRETQ